MLLIFLSDKSFIIDKFIIEGNQRFVHRCLEIGPIPDILTAKSNHSEVIYLAARHKHY